MAVSEKEDGATGERTLTRMTGAMGMTRVTGATRTEVTRVAGNVWSIWRRRQRKRCGLNHHLLEKNV